jgi:acetamidase/formamidase
MATYTLNPDPATLHGHFSADLRPVLTIASGDTVRYRLPDAGWHAFEQEHPFAQAPSLPWRDRQRDPGHALCGPIAIDGARAGMTLEIVLHTIRPGSWGWVSAGFSHPRNPHLGLPAHGSERVMCWRLDAQTGTATNQRGQTLNMRPFLGILGMPPPEAGQHSTIPPRFCGGNIDCKELIVGSRVFLPIPVDRGLFSLGDGHAVQGDGEVAGPALECPMDLVEVTFHLHADMQLEMPRANTPAGWITFGFDRDLAVAGTIALNGMLDLMEAMYQVDRTDALALASLVVDLRITQIVNGICGVHAILPHTALREPHAPV